MTRLRATALRRGLPSPKRSFGFAQPGGPRRSGASRGGGFRVVPLEARHLETIRLQPAQAALRPMLGDGYLRELAERSYGFTALDGLDVVACAGVIPVWPDRDCAWALLSRCGPARFLRVHRAVAEFLAGRPTRRIEITVDVGHAAARRWARLLCFEAEGVLRAYTPDGRDVYSYARVCNERI